MCLPKRTSCCDGLRLMTGGRRKTPVSVNGRLPYWPQAFFAVEKYKVPPCFWFVSSKMVKSIIE